MTERLGSEGVRIQDDKKEISKYKNKEEEWNSDLLSILQMTAIDYPREKQWEIGRELMDALQGLMY